MDGYISIQAALKKIEFLLMPSVVGKSVKEEIAAMPAADVRPVVRGHWIPVTNGRGGHECDQCHDYAPSMQSGGERLSNFCPNCGADMREAIENVSM